MECCGLVVQLSISCRFVVDFVVRLVVQQIHNYSPTSGVQSLSYIGKKYGFRPTRTERLRTRREDNITKCTGLKSDVLLRSVEDRTRWRTIVHEAANHLIEDA